MSIDKIGYRVYNVHRTMQGGYISIYWVNIQLPPRVFPGILSEYLSYNMARNMVYMGFGDFIVGVYIVYRIPPLAHA